MDGQQNYGDPLPENLEFEGRFMSSHPIANNTFWWHHEQNAFGQQLPDFIPIRIDTGASAQSDSEGIESGSGHSRQMEFEHTFLGVGSGSNRNNLPFEPTAGTYQGDDYGNSSGVGNNSISQLAAEDLLTNMVPLRHARAEHIATASSSAHTSMNFLQTGINFREDVNRTDPAAVTTNSSDKRKSTENCCGESSTNSSKRSIQNAGCSAAHAAPSRQVPCCDFSSSSSSADIYGPGLLGTLSFETLPPPRSSVFDSPQPGTARSDYNGQVSRIARNNTSLQGSAPANFAFSRTVVSHNRNNVAHRPLLDLSSPQAVGEGSNVQNQPMPSQCPVTLQQEVHFTRHHNGPRNMFNNSSGFDFVHGTTQMGEIGLRNSTHSLEFPVIAPPVGLTNLAHNTMDFSGGNSSIPMDNNLRTPSNPNPPVHMPNIASSSHRRRRLELIRQTLLEVDSFSGASIISDPEDHRGFTPETTQRLISRARHLINMYRGGRNVSLLEEGSNARHSLFSALASIHDQHREMRLDVDNMSYEELLELGERIGDVKTGLSEETIMGSLKHTEYTFTLKPNQPNAEPCSICREEYAEGENLGTLECGHEYHTNCIKQWLVIKNSCPICKAVAYPSSK